MTVRHKEQTLESRVFLFCLIKARFSLQRYGWWWFGEAGVEHNGQGGAFFFAVGVPFADGGGAFVEGGVAVGVVGGSFFPPLILLAADFLDEVWPTVWRALTTSVDNFLIRNSFSLKLIIWGMPLCLAASMSTMYLCISYLNS